MLPNNSMTNPLLEAVWRISSAVAAPMATVRAVIAAIADVRRRAGTVDVLEELSDHQLNDIGVTRDMIQRMRRDPRYFL